MVFILSSREFALVASKRELSCQFSI